VGPIVHACTTAEALSRGGEVVARWVRREPAPGPAPPPQGEELAYPDPERSRGGFAATLVPRAGLEPALHA
jgi:hypothetical protein